MNKATFLGVKAFIYILWPATAYATTITLGQTLTEVPALAWLMVFILSSISGLAALLHVLKDQTPPKLRLFISAHMLGSLVSGLLVFFIASGAQMQDYYQAGLISVGAFAGARLLSAAADKMVKKAGE